MLEVRPYSRTELEAAKRQDQAMGARRRKMGDLRVGKTGRLRQQISTTAFFNAVNQEGPELATAAGDQYWRDQERLHPWIGDGSVIGAQASANGMACRLGRVREKTVYHKDGTKTVVTRDARGELQFEIAEFRSKRGRAA
jgi:hypothetical protein